MGVFTIRIAGAAAQIHSRFDSTIEYFRQYLADCPPELRIAVSPEELRHEQVLLDEEADREGLRRRVFTEPFLERAVIQRKMAAFLLCRDTLLLHGSTIVADGRAYLFTAPCGVGKSTHTRLWQQLLGDRAVILNDDRAFLHIAAEGVTAYSSPWSGKHGLNTNIHAPLAGICILRRGMENRISPLSPEDGLTQLLEQVFLPEDSGGPALNRLACRLADSVPLWQMACTRDLEAAQIAFRAMAHGMENP